MGFFFEVALGPVGRWVLSWRLMGCPPPHPCTAVRAVPGEYYLNGHWTISTAQALPVASTILHYERGSEGDLAPQRLHARGPTSEPLVIEVSVVEDCQCDRFQRGLAGCL